MVRCVAPTPSSFVSVLAHIAASNRVANNLTMVFDGSSTVVTKQPQYNIYCLGTHFDG